ncbi:MAG TPA: hypothetical protein VFC63_23975 [Blastocatellia bacterium]|nr:hypothetical protein [Blastocatellia bacterium]
MAYRTHQMILGPAFFFEVLRRRIGIIIVSTIVAVGLTIPVILLIHKHYKASVKILVTDPVLSGNTTVQEPLLHRDQDTATKLGDVNNIVKSDLFLSQAVTKLTQKDTFAWTPTVEKIKDGVNAVLNQSSLEITVDSPDPEVSVKLARILGDQFKEWMSQVEVRPTGDTAEAIKEKADDTQKEINDLQHKLEIFKGTNKDALPDAFQNYLLQKQNLESLVLNGRVELEKLRNEYTALQDRLHNDASLRADPENPTAKKLQELRAEYASMMATRKETHPQVTELKKQIEELEKALMTPPANGQVSLSVPYRTVDTRVKEVRMQIDQWEKSLPLYQQDLDRLNGNLKKMPASEQTIAELTFQIKTKQEILDKLNQEQAGALLSTKILTQVEDNKYITVSTPTTASAEPNPKLLLGAALAGGLALGLIMAIIFELMDPVVYGAAQLEAQAGLPLLTVISERALLK